MNKARLKERADKMKAYVPAMFICMKRKETPFAAKAAAALAVVYALSPIDLIPDFIPVLGLLDDIIIVPALIALVIKLVPKKLMEECLAEAEKRGKAKGRWYYAVPIAAVWLLILWIIFKAIFLRD